MDLYEQQLAAITERNILIEIERLKEHIVARILPNDTYICSVGKIEGLRTALECLKGADQEITQGPRGEIKVQSERPFKNYED
jgi:hypothetical protein